MTPWLALFISKSISSKSGFLVILTLVLYTLTILTDFFDGLLARQISKEKTHDHATGGMLDRLSDKILIIFLLIPFGLNLFTVLIIAGESLLAYQAINSTGHKKQATNAGKLKMLFQALFIPILLLSKTSGIIPNDIVYLWVIAIIILTYTSVYSHYFKND